LAKYQEALERKNITFSSDLGNVREKRDLVLCGVVVNLKEMKTKKKDTMAYVQLEDLRGTFTAICFSDAYMKSYALFHDDKPLILKGYADNQDEEIKVIVNEVADLEDFLRGLTSESSMHIYLQQEGRTEEEISSLKGILNDHPGNNETFIHLLNHSTDTVICLGSRHRICRELEEQISVSIDDAYVKYLN